MEEHPEPALVDARSVLFTQDRVSPHFSKGRPAAAAAEQAAAANTSYAAALAAEESELSLEGAVAALLQGAQSVLSFPPIQCIQLPDGRLASLDNRR